MKGMFITIEGTDGAGKSTQIGLLAEFLRQKGLPVVLTREPGGTAIGEKIRALLLDEANREMTPVTEALLYAASRAQHVSQTIRPALEAGKIVICDRFFDSSLVYQAWGRNLGEALVQSINQWALDGLEPDCTLLFSLQVADGMARAAKDHAPDRLELEGISFQQKVYDAYQTLAKRYPKRIVAVNAAQSVEEVAKEVQEAIWSRIVEKTTFDGGVLK